MKERHKQLRGWVLAGACALALLPAVGAVLAQGLGDEEDETIRYTKTASHDPIVRLQEKIDRGEARLQWEPKHGYLGSVLKALGISPSSQMLVFSKTSFQRDRIAPRTPRALYFNDETYIGWVQNGDVVEVATTDPQLGSVFYVLSQDPSGKPHFQRQNAECLQCHSSALTSGVPGIVMRSVTPDPDGQPILSAGTSVTTDESPLKERWGGWYVTGRHGAQRHLGNLVVANARQAEKPNLEPGANVTNLKRFFDPAPYLSPHSDIVALMVSEHQTRIANLITRANYQTRIAERYEEVLGKELGKPAGGHLDSTLSRVRSVCEPLVRALLFTDEVTLTAPITGTSGFSAEFARRGPRDSRGRSLRDLDLHARLFRHPCSYLIYSEAFDGLPPMAKEYVYRRLEEVLSGQDQRPEFARLTSADRQSIREILHETKPDFARVDNEALARSTPPATAPATH